MPKISILGTRGIIQIPAPLGSELCLYDPSKCWIWLSLFFLYIRQNLQQQLSYRPFPLRHLLAKVNLLPLNTSKLKEEMHLLCWKDLTVWVQIPNPTQGRFKFPTPEYGGQSHARGLPGRGGEGGVTVLNWSAHYFDEKFRETVAAIGVFQLSV